MVTLELFKAVGQAYRIPTKIHILIIFKTIRKCSYSINLVNSVCAGTDPCRQMPPKCKWAMWWIQERFITRFWTLTVLFCEVIRDGTRGLLEKLYVCVCVCVYIYIYIYTRSVVNRNWNGYVWDVTVKVRWSLIILRGRVACLWLIKK